MSDRTERLAKPLVIFDGDCGFCRRAVERSRRLTGEEIDYAPYQDLADPFAGVSHRQFAQSVHLIGPSGEILTGARAVFQTLHDGAQKRWPLWIYRQVPGAAPIAELGYRLVASNRRAASKLAVIFWRQESELPRFLLTRWLFIRLVALIYCIAFASLGVQVLGLIGSRGILPAGAYFERLQGALGQAAYLAVPSLGWFSTSDGFLLVLCWGGAALALLVVFRIAPGLLLTALWAMYLSLYHMGQIFLGYQWDILLLETGLLAMFFAPWQLRPKLAMEPEPSRAMVWLIRWLAFRLMFCSGVVKLLDENPLEPTWRQLTALTYHYETQCIPTALAWYAHQLPLWFHQLSVVGVFLIEIGAPFLIFLGRRPRIFACMSLLFLQLLIILTGNYNFFNLLSIALCIVLLDDRVLRRLFTKRRVQEAAAPSGRRCISAAQRWLTNMIATFVLVISGTWMVATFIGFGELPAVGQNLLRYSSRFASVNSYGLFRSMTTSRPEIIVEGSSDGEAWLAYEFKWKPGDLSRRPRFVAPHQPRLDWQMWFAALGNFNSPRNAWFRSFLKRILEGETEVLRLLETNPFPEKPPRFVRAVLYDYRFTDFDTRRDQGTWWQRTNLGDYSPVISLESFRPN